MKKSVTVVIPAYNAETTLEKAVQSVLDQTVKVESIIIVNDGSKDNTLK
ncbi:MAG: glycosyltransferase, partial [Spirochaetaceae bacterium]|nr:glycosyltransferase [Spirochaetaceae bacterium]